MYHRSQNFTVKNFSSMTFSDENWTREMFCVMHVDLQYRSQLTWQMSASSEEVTRGCKRHPRCAKCEYSHTRAYPHTLVSPIIAQWWQNQDNRQFARLSYFLINTGEFTERREVVKDSLGIDKLPILYFFMTSLEYLWAWSRALSPVKARDLQKALASLMREEKQ